MDYNEARAITMKNALTDEELKEIIKGLIDNKILYGVKLSENAQAVADAVSPRIDMIEEYFPHLIKEVSEFYMEDKLIDQAEKAGIHLDRLIERAMHRKMGV